MGVVYFLDNLGGSASAIPVWGVVMERMVMLVFLLKGVVESMAGEWR